MDILPYHIPALLPESLNALNIKSNGIYIDATFGGGGHSRAIVERLDAEAGGHLYAFDQDAEALERAFKDPRLTVIHSNFRHMANFMRFFGCLGSVDGILADLGVSFHHFDDPDRGFSFRWEQGPLDMRMNRNTGLTAADLVNRAEADELAHILTLYGELKNGRRIAQAIVKARAKAEITTVDHLLQTVSPLVNPAHEKKDLARLFQALRIRVNDEIGALRSLLEASAGVLAPEGRLAIITYHSLEDRLVKNYMRTGNLDGKAQTDFYGNLLTPFRLLTSKPITPSEAEIEANPRSRSAKLRVAEKKPV